MFLFCRYVQGTSSWQKLQYKHCNVHVVVEIIRVYRYCRAHPPSESGCSSQFQGMGGGGGVKGLVPSHAIYNIFLFSNSYRDGQERERKKKTPGEMKGDRKWMIYSCKIHTGSVLIPCIRSAVEAGETEATGALETLLFFFLESANHVARHRTCQWVPVVNIKTAHFLWLIEAAKKKNLIHVRLQSDHVTTNEKALC